MSAQQMMMTDAKSYHKFVVDGTGGTGQYYIDGCALGIYGYVSGSLGSITVGSTFRNLTITEFATYSPFASQNDSQNQDPQEWYCVAEAQYTILKITGATDQFFFKRIVSIDAGTIVELLSSSDASFSSGTWEWPYGISMAENIYIEY